MDPWSCGQREGKKLEQSGEPGQPTCNRQHVTTRGQQPSTGLASLGILARSAPSNSSEVRLANGTALGGSSPRLKGEPIISLSPHRGIKVAPAAHPHPKSSSPGPWTFLSASPRSCRSSSGPGSARLCLFYSLSLCLTSSPRSLSFTSSLLRLTFFPYHPSPPFLSYESLPSRLPLRYHSPSNRNTRFHLHVHPWSLAPSRRLVVQRAATPLITTTILIARPLLPQVAPS
jgi:hypothetical protein